MENDMSAMSGEIKRPPRLVLNEINLNGATGKFRLMDMVKGKDPATDRVLFKEMDNEIAVVFLKVRRRLTEFQKGRGLVRITSEHNFKDDMVMMFGDSQQKGVASQLRVMFDKLRTQQIVYCRFRGQIIRLIVKGASLGSEKKAATTTSFYDYLDSFGDNEHFYEYETVLKPVEESGPLGAYFAIDFSRGKKLTKEQLDLVEKDMRKVHEYTTRSDAHYGVIDAKTASPMGASLPSRIAEKEEVTIEYPEEEINPDEIPF